MIGDDKEATRKWKQKTDKERGERRGVRERTQEEVFAYLLGIVILV